MGSVMKKHPDLTRSLFVADSKCTAISSDALLALITSNKPTDGVQGTAYDFFFEFVSSLEGMCIVEPVF
jgi:hypothetical protein